MKAVDEKLLKNVVKVFSDVIVTKHRPEEMALVISLYVLGYLALRQFGS